MLVEAICCSVIEYFIRIDQIMKERTSFTTCNKYYYKNMYLMSSSTFLQFVKNGYK